MALTPLNFPNAPTIGQTYPSPPVTGQPTYIWDGADWLSYFALGKAYVPLDGSQPMTGLLTLSGDPTVALNAATKHYVDGSVSGAIAGQPLPLVRSYIAGLTLSTPGTSINFTVQPGVAADSTNVVMMTLAAALAKTTAAWVVGTGGALDTGAIAANTWYHVYLIRRPDTGVVDVLCSLSATAPTLPANYTQFRRIGAMKTNASSQWIAFHQYGDKFLWDTPISDVTNVAIGNTSTSVTLSTPLGVAVEPIISLAASKAATVVVAYLRSPGAADLDPVTTNAATYTHISPASGQLTVHVMTGSHLMTGVSSEIYVRFSTAAVATYIGTFGWTDRRGRDA